MKNKNDFCDIADLKNEADVEQIFARRLIEFLKYKDDQIRPKDSLDQLSVKGMHHKAAKYRPDFCMIVSKQPRWILEAKSPQENLDDHVWQPRGYCDLLNGEYHNENPVKYFVLSNGIKTRLYQWDRNAPLLNLDFYDFVASNRKFESLIALLTPTVFKKSGAKTQVSNLHRLEKKPIEDVNSAFAWCHQHIYKKDNISQAAAFTEFVKVVFLKLLSDRRIRDKYPDILAQDTIDIPSADVTFSLQWIEENEKVTANPIDTIQFHDFIAEMEKEVQSRKRKRMFGTTERIALSPETIRGVVERLEHLFLFGIDIDLNGRLFETFLNATMRGKDLGQFFTPRSIVTLGIRLARLRVNTPMPDGSFFSDTVLDACCGTGGFLIDALADMWAKVNGNTSLSEVEKEKLRRRIADRHIYGIDVAVEPPLARIARLNMYLHGDGGSCIFQVDSLDKEISSKVVDNPELGIEKTELRSLFKSGGLADVVVTNPPFAKVYERKTESESKILDSYSISTKDGGDKRASLKSSLMFIERYYDLLKTGGRLVTVIDDGILNGGDSAWFRGYIRDHFIIKAIVSLPGDAFQRSKARVKTSLLVAEKRDLSSAKSQPDVFMYACEYVGIDDPSRQRTLPIDHENKKAAVKEIQTVDRLFTDFLAGRGDPRYIVPSKKLTDRLDVKSCLMVTGRMIGSWQAKGFDVVSLGQLSDQKTFQPEDIIETKQTDETITYLRVTYSGFAEAGEEINSSDTDYAFLYRIHEGDIVISNIAASYGSTAVVPASLDGCVITSEYTVLQPKTGVSPIEVWLLLRSPEARAEMLLQATGISRNRVKWSLLKTLKLPRPDKSMVEKIISLTRKAEEAELIANECRESAKESLETSLSLNTDEAWRILRAFKPPK